MSMEKIKESFSNFQNNGSGWIFSKIMSLDLHVDKYEPISAESYIDLPKWLKDKKAIINPKNEDNDVLNGQLLLQYFQ